MSRVLFLTPQLPYPPHQGAAIRNLNLIKLASQRHEVFVASFVRSEAELAGVGPLGVWARDVRTAQAPARSLVERALWTAFSFTPDMGRRLESAGFRQMLDAFEPDAVQVEGIEVAQFGPALHRPAIFDCHNAEWRLQSRTFSMDQRQGKWVGAVYSALQAAKLRRYERAICRHSQAVLAVSDDDAGALRDLDPNLHIDVIPNGVDATEFHPSASPPAQNSFLFTGTLDFRPNVDAVLWLARDIWPLIRRRLPEARLTIAGRAPLPPISTLHGNNGIEVQANPPDIIPFFERAAVYLAPVRAGGGSRYKLLQALSMGVPIVSTTLGAEGLAVEPGVHLRLSDAPASFADIALDLASDPAARQRLSEAGRQLVLDRYDWPVIGPSLWAVYDRVLAS